jgi:two-component system OmpR family sensor kinase
MTGAFLVTGVLALVGVRGQLDRELDASIVAVASIQASSVTDSPDGQMHLHEWELSPDEARSVSELIRYAQVWSLEGRSLLRSQFMASDLPVDPDALASASAGEIVWREHTYEDQPVRAVYYPLDRFGPMHNEHVLQVAAPMAARNGMITRGGLLLLLVAGAVAITSFTGSWWLAGRVVRPVNEVIDQAEEIGAGSLDSRINAYADAAEYRRLVEVLNTMLGRIQRAYQAQERFAADASHELRSPLTVLRGEIEVALRRERATAEYREVLESALEEIDRLTGIAEKLLAAARPETDLHSDAGPVDVGPLATDMAEKVLSRYPDRGVTVSVAVAGAAHVHSDPALISQVIWNLVDNAVRLSPDGAAVDVALEVGANQIQVRVLDRGPGVGTEPERIFERFYRADPVRTPGPDNGNTGLGLAIVRSLAVASGGGVSARDREGGGAVVEVSLGTGRQGRSSSGRGAHKYGGDQEHHLTDQELERS